MKKISIEKLFLIIGFIFGCLFIYVIPPFQSPDEDSHFKKAYAISQGDFYEDANEKITGLYIPNVMNDYANDKLGMMGNRDLKYSYSSFYYDQLLANDFTDKTLIQVSTSGTTPLAHIIPAFGILVSKILSPIFVDGTPSTAFMLQFARFFSLISYLVIGYFAIKTTPYFKKSMYSILLLPMSLFLGSMVSYDNLMIATTLLAIANILKLIYDKKQLFDKKIFLLFTLIGYILLNVKIIYAPFLLLLAFIPKEKFKNGNNKEKIKTFLTLFVAIVILTILLKIPQLLLETKSSSSTLSMEQFEFILSNPFKYIGILINNMLNQFWIQMYWMTGTFGLLDTYIPPIFMLMSLCNLIIVFISDAFTEKVKIERIQRVSLLLILGVSIAGMYTAMYLCWTPKVLGVIGGSEITGVQGRYFIPLLILLPMLLSNNYFTKFEKIKRIFNNYFEKVVIVSTTCLIVSVIVCLTRFWM